MSRSSRPPASPPPFDYFGEIRPASPRPAEELEPVGGARAAAGGGGRGRLLLTAATCALFFAATGWYGWGARDDVAYALAAPHPPQPLGDAVDLRPEQVPHNAFVTVHGITEHRGLRQQMVRGLTLTRTPFWYFRLLGSRGLFIEVPADPSKYGTTTEVTVSGRAIDPARAPQYARLIRSYGDIFGATPRPVSRVLRVGDAPGLERRRTLLLGGVLATLGAANLWALGRELRRHWQGRARPDRAA